MKIVPAEIKVLIAEDDFLIAEETSRLVKKLGYQVIGVASNGMKAIEMCGKLRPDLILMDIKMPKIDGLEASQIITHNFEDVSIVILSAHESHDLLEKATESGIGAYLSKPPQIEELDRALIVALARHRDLEESRKLIKQLEESRKQLKDTNASKDKFFSIIAHDLRNPVSAMSAFTEQLILNLDAISKDELLQYIHIIRKTAHGLSDLLEELLLWASIQTNRYDFSPEECILDKEVSLVVSLLGASAAQKNLQIKCDFPLQVKVIADKNMVHTILRNLVSNAIKFTQENGKVSIGCKVDTTFVTIAIEDSGVGISHERLGKLFSLENQLSTPGTIGETGTGLGLILCREMVEKNQGKIWVESQLGKGSKFMFTLPSSPNLKPTSVAS